VYKWQINKQISVNFTVERTVFCFFWLLWLGYGFLLCHLGFGEDTDAWLMAQTAQKLSLGQGYDPARSFGNPLYEFLLVLIQPKQNWFLSNVFSLLLASVFLWRLRSYFLLLTEIQLLIARLSVMVLPVFIEAATSSIEYLLGWLLLFETLHASKNVLIRMFWCFLILAVFTRLEFFILLIPIFFPKNEKVFPFFFLIAVFFSFLFWSFGKNPAPFYFLQDAIHFYAGRIFFLFKQAGAWLPIYLILLMGILLNKQIEPWYWKTGIIGLVFFIFFPFEWAYCFPVMLFGLVAWIPIGSKPIQVAIPILFFLLSTFDFKSFSFFNLPPNYKRRLEMTKLYQEAQVCDFKQATLFLEGATYLPTDTRNWEKLMGNRLFHRKNSNFFVGEKLTVTELDSLKKTGMEIKERLSGP